MVQLVFLHGPPASGKFTIGRELAALTGFELFHNHVVVDEVLRRHAFGSAEFVAERDRAWRAHLTAAVTAGQRGLIFTFNPENSVPQTFIDWLFAELVCAGPVSLHSVELTAGEATIEHRLSSEPRREFRKLTDVALYRDLRSAGAFRSPVIPRTDLLIDTESLAPGDAARKIVRAFALA